MTEPVKCVDQSLALDNNFDMDMDMDSKKARVHDLLSMDVHARTEL